MSDIEYQGEFRYVNKSPQELRRMLEAETDPKEREVIEWTLQAFQRKGWAAGDPDDPRATKAGEPYRGEPKVADMPAGIRDMTKNRKPVEHIFTGEGMRRDNLDVGATVTGRELPDDMKNGDGLFMVEGPGGVWEEK